MPQASRDENNVPTLLAVSSVDGVTPVRVYADPITHRLLVDIAGGGATPGGADGDVQYNNAGAFGGDSGMHYDKAGSLTLTETIFAENLGLEDTNASHYLIFACGSDLTANRILTISPGDAARTITLTGNPTLADWFDQSVKQAATPVFAGASLQTGVTTVGTMAGSIDMTSATFLKIPNSNAPTVNANGIVAIDNLVTDFAAGILKYFSTAEMGIVAMPVAQFTSPQDGYLVTYNASNDQFELTAPSGGGANTALSNLAAVSINTSLLAQTGVDLGSTVKPFHDIFIYGGGTYGTHYIQLTGTPTGGRVLTLPNATDTLMGKATTDTMTNKTYDTAGTGNSFLINGVAVTANTGSGAVVRASGATLTSPTITTEISPTTDDGAPLGDTTHNWSDLFLATGAVINYANGNVLITHTSGILTMGTGEMRISTPGTNAASVATLNGTQAFQNKTITNSNNVLGGVTMTLGSDASNDMYYRNGSGILTRLANGTTGQVLKATTGAAPSWGSVPSPASFPSTQAFSGTAPNFTWTDLDLSSIVGAAQKIVILAITGSTNARYAIRRKGDTFDYLSNNTTNSSSSNTGASSGAIGGTVGYTLLIGITDTNGVIQWNCTTNVASTVVTVLAYF